MIVNVVVQARMGSTRLPGKVMLMAGGKPLIGHLVDRLKRCRRVDRVVVAGSERDQSSSLQAYLHSRKIDHYFGDPENDLCARFLSALALFPCDAFVRVCGDSPLIEPENVDLIADALRSGLPFSSNVGLKCIPSGQSAEGCTVPLYLDLCKACAPEDREHAGFPYLYREIAKHNSLVDTPEDFERVKKMIEDA